MVHVCGVDIEGDMVTQRLACYTLFKEVQP